MTSTYSHELITPVRCIIAFAEELDKGIKINSELHKKAILIKNTGKILLSQVKMQLDNGLVQNNLFEPNLSKGKLLDVLKQTSEILEGQASIRQITIKFEPKCAQIYLIFD